MRRGGGDRARGRTVAQGTVAELARAARATSRRPSCASPSRRNVRARADAGMTGRRGIGRPDMDRLDRVREGVVDALRDRRTLAVVLLSSVLMGPLVLVALSGLLASFESRAERREVVAGRRRSAPTLVNYIARQGFTVKPAPADYEAQLKRAELGDPVLVIPQDFEAALKSGDLPRLLLVSDSANKARRGGRRAPAAPGGRLHRERATLALALRGVSVELLESARVDEARSGQPADARHADHRHAALLRADGGALRRAQRRAGQHRRRTRARLARAAADEPGRAAGHRAGASGRR